MQDVRLKLSPPWITYLNKLSALFDGDPEISVRYDNADYRITLSTTNGDKAAALLKVLPDSKAFGNVNVKLDVEGPVSDLAFPTNESLMNTLFSKNPALAYVHAVDGFIFDFTYVVFKNTVVQFFNDNLHDIHGIISTLYQDIASELFEDANLYGVYYCTDVEYAIGKPLGEWP